MAWGTIGTLVWCGAIFLIAGGFWVASRKEKKLDEKCGVDYYTKGNDQPYNLSKWTDPVE